MTRTVRSTGSLREDGTAGASASLVMRTRRVVAERAAVLRGSRARLRALLIPMLISAATLLIACTAVWSVLDGYDLVPTGVPDASSQIFVLLVWFFPVTTAVLAVVWLRRAHGRGDGAR